MIFYAPLICWYVFWKSFFEKTGVDIDIPIMKYLTSHMTVCGEV